MPLDMYYHQYSDIKNKLKKKMLTDRPTILALVSYPNYIISTAQTKIKTTKCPRVLVTPLQRTDTFVICYLMMAMYYS